MELDPRLGSIWVRGEIGTYRHHSSGHVFFTLRDEETLLRCVMFRSFARRLRFKPNSGLDVLAFGEISVYERDGAYQLYVRELQPDGLGAQHLALKQTKERLAREGLFSPDRKRPLPSFPRQVAVVTSPAGAAFQDILAVAQRRFSAVKIFLCPVLVQGEHAADQIVYALKKLNDLEQIDVIILARGGGSKEDLWVFNDEKLARQVAASKPPVVSAVGHEIDYTLTDLVADVRAATPSAAAELVFPDARQIEKELFYFSQRLDKAFKRCLIDCYLELDDIRKRQPWRRPLTQLTGRQQVLKSLESRLARSKINFMTYKKTVLTGMKRALLVLDPLAVQKRGFALVFDHESGSVVARAGQTFPGQNLNVRFADGEVLVRVITAMQGDDRDA